MSVSDFSFGMHALSNSWNTAGAPAHNGMSINSMIDLAAQGGGGIVRVPVDLSVVTNSGTPQWQLDIFADVLQTAALNNVEVIFEPGQTPLDLLPPGSSVGDVPSEQWAIDALANRYAVLVEQVHSNFPQYADTIAGWEVGNEPNLSYQYTGTYYGGQGDPSHPRYYAVSTDNAEYYARYLHAVDEAVKGVEASLGQDIQVIGAGIAHNDYAYMDTMFATLKNLGADIDAFAIHPYTTYDYYASQPQSGRPTDWIPNPTDAASGWDYNFSFQGALYNIQYLKDYHGFENSDLWITEFGVPSYLGYRGAGAAGEIDQANFMAEAIGVLDSWDNADLKGIMAHMVLDNYYKETNEYYNAYDGDGSNNGNTAIAEGSFGLYGRYADGTIYAKPAVGFLQAVTAGVDFSNPNIRILNVVSSDTTDLSQWGSDGVGYLDGYIVLTNDGNDTLNGSQFSDSLFVGNGDDTAAGNGGDDRIYGGQGNDDISGNDGDDDLYGNTGDDRLNGGNGSNRIDGGTGWDTVVVDGSSGAYNWNGNGWYVTISADNGSQFTAAINVEAIYFAGDNVTVTLSDSDVLRGNGGVSGSSGGATAPTPADDSTSVAPGGSVVIDVLANDTDPNGDTLTITQINGVDMQPGWQTWVAEADGLVIYNADGTLTYQPSSTASGTKTFTYTVSDGSEPSIATVTATVAPVTTAPTPVDDSTSVAPGGSVVIDVLANDTDPNGDTLTITQINGVDMQPGWQTWVAEADGLVIYNADGTLTYQPSSTASGTKTFTYTVSDGSETSTATVNVGLSQTTPSAAPTATWTGTDGDDWQWLSNADDVIDAGKGNDDINGAGGSDTFLWRTGDGNDTFGVFADQGDTDEVFFLDVAPNDVSVSSPPDWDTHIALTVTSTGEVITLTDQLGSGNEGSRFDQVKFADGTIWDFATLEQLAQGITLPPTPSAAPTATWTGTDGDDWQWLSNADDIIDAGKGNDDINGAGGSDTFLWRTGDGSDTFGVFADQGDTDEIFLLDVDSSDVSIGVSPDWDTHIVINVASTGEVITLTDQLGANNESSRFDQIRFADGSITTFDEFSLGV
ncbi:Ig-like domain-containing protein [Labrenzia sp. CE80]|uniref:Ig-like domain-containing protein n=1 Tax=Labrenzia sp. CE80 TaxID=1788986 RepID=UPI00129B68B1|nr:Ig-like domain-containing protein [Labrenzia sp. CE80]